MVLTAQYDEIFFSRNHENWLPAEPKSNFLLLGAMFKKKFSTGNWEDMFARII